MATDNPHYFLYTLSARNPDHSPMHPPKRFARARKASKKQPPSPPPIDPEESNMTQFQTEELAFIIDGWKAKQL